MAMTPLPWPPLELANRVGDLSEAEQLKQYEAAGVVLKLGILDALPSGWDWAGCRGLDFGCGAGRVLRHFAIEAETAELWGCDIDAASVAWMREFLSPPFHPFLVGETPGLPHEDEYFDVAWAYSVFTHLTDDWAGWLLELHRVLRAGGYLISTFLGESIGRDELQEPWDEDRVGMNVVGAGVAWEDGGPSVFHSTWWLHAHWGRAFEIVQIQTNEDLQGTQGLVVLRKKPVQLTVAELTLPEPGEPREAAAWRHNLAQLHAEDRRMRERLMAAERRVKALEPKPKPRGIAHVRSLLRRNDSRSRIRPGH